MFSGVGGGRGVKQNKKCELETANKSELATFSPPPFLFSVFHYHGGKYRQINKK